jgi:predicted ester cyclase
MRGTQTGPFALANLQPTGKQIEITGIDIVRIAGGKIVEWWHQEDIMAMMMQLGVMPTPD